MRGELRKRDTRIYKGILTCCLIQLPFLYGVKDFVK